MSWYYYDNEGQKKGPFSGDQLKELVKQGLVTRETRIENDKGQSGPAKKVPGLPFPEMPKPVPPPQPVGQNPFTAPMPAPDNPFVVAQPPGKTVPSVIKTPKPKRVSVPPTDGEEEDGDRISLWVPIVGVLLVLIVCAIGWWAIFPVKEKPAPPPPPPLPVNPQPVPSIPVPPSIVQPPEAPPADSPNDPLPEKMLIAPNDDRVYYFNSTYVASPATLRGGYDVYIDNNNTAYAPSYPQIVDNVRSVYTIAYEYNNTYFFIKMNNELWAKGYNQYGQVGDDTGLDQSTPVLVMKDVANLYFERSGLSGNSIDTIYALKTDKSRWGWGRGVKNGQIAYAPIRTHGNFNHNQQLLADHISMTNGNPDIYTMIPLSNEIEAILGGKDKITTSIEIEHFDWDFGGNKTKDPKKSRFYAITKDGTLWGWGFNDGELGDGTKASRDRPVKIAENVKRLLSEYFITKSNDWYYYSDIYCEPKFCPQIALENVLYAYSPTRGNAYSNGEWYTPDGKLCRGIPAFRNTPFKVREIISDIKLPSIVRASDGQVIAPRPE